MRLLFIATLFSTFLLGNSAFAGGGGRGGGGGGAAGKSSEHESSSGSGSESNSGSSSGSGRSSGSTGSGSSNGVHIGDDSAVASSKGESLAHALEGLSELIKELGKIISDNDDETSSTTRSSYYYDDYSSTTRTRPTRTRTTRSIDASARSVASRVLHSSTSSAPSVTGDATGCLIAQSIYSTCSQAYVSVDGIEIITHTGTASTSYPAQASCLCYTTATNVASTFWAASQYDGYVSQCSRYLATASLPATTTVSSNAAVVTASALQLDLNDALGFCSVAGDVRKPTVTPTIAPPTSGAAWTGGASSSAISRLAGIGLIYALMII